MTLRKLALFPSSLMAVIIVTYTKTICHILTTDHLKMQNQPVKQWVYQIYFPEWPKVPYYCNVMTQPLSCIKYTVFAKSNLNPPQKSF